MRPNAPLSLALSPLHGMRGRGKSFRAAVALLLLLGAFATLLALLPLRTSVLIGADEGFALSKAALYLKGYRFYTEVWSDQPLLHTFLIAQVLTHISPSVLGPRLLTSGFAVLLLASVFTIGRRVGGLVVGALATGLLLASPGFLELSASCMVEIPALALPIAALCVLLVAGRTRDELEQVAPLPGPLSTPSSSFAALGRDKSRGQGEGRAVGSWHLPEILAGVIFGAALHIKFNGAIYLPLAALTLWLREREAGLPAKAFVESLLVLLASLAATFVAVHSLIGEGSYLLQFKQAWAAHVAPATTSEYGSPADHPFQWSVLLKNWDVTLPAAFGVIFCIKQARLAPVRVLPVVWLGLTLAVFAAHKPWWTYYYLHNSVPLCLCAAIGVRGLWEAVRLAPVASPQSTVHGPQSTVQGPKPGVQGGAAIKIKRRIKIKSWAVVLGAYCVCAVGWMGVRIYLQAAGIRRSPQLYSCLVLKEIEPLKPFTAFMFTDQPIYSFHAGIPMPPRLAMITLKRLWSGDLTDERIAAELRTVKPGVILLPNDTRELPYQDLLEGAYRLVYEDGDHRLYALKTVIKEADR